MDARARRIKQFLMRMLSVDDIEADDDVFAMGLVNSLFAMQLVAFVEREFAVAMTARDLTLDNFRSINAMSALVQRKRPRRSP
jgi:methoxymalonate biosynthesis acyl carrier protein